MHDEQRPDAGSIEQLAAHLKAVWQDAHDHWIEIDKYYHRTFPLWTQAEMDSRGELPEYHPSRATGTIDHAVDNQLAHEPRVNRFASSSKDKDRKSADRVEPFVHAVFMESALLEPSLTWKQVAKNLVMYGYAVVEGPTLDSSERPPKPRMRRGEDQEEWDRRLTLWENSKKTWMPFRIRAPHPATVLLEPMNKRPHEGVKIVTRYAIDLERLTKNRLDKNGKPKRRDSAADQFDCGNEPYREVDTIEYWSLHWHALTAEGKLLFVEPNTWGFLPFKHAFAGFGQMKTDSTGIEVRDLAVGILDPILDSLLVQAQAMTGVHNSLIEAAFPDRIVTGDAESVRNQKARGARIIQLKNGEKIEFEHPPEIARWMLEAEKLVSEDIDFGSFSKVLSGGRNVGTYTVGQTAIQMNSAEKKFLATGQQMEHLATLVGQDILKLIDVLDEQITVRGFTIRPSDIAHDYSLEVKFEIVDPVLEQQRRQIAMQEVQAGLKSSETYWNETRLADASGERMRILEDKLRANPIVEQAFIEEMARLFGLMPLLDQIKKQREAGATPAPGTSAMGGGQPPIAGPDGLPLDQTMGGAQVNMAMPEGLTGAVPGVPRMGQGAAGSPASASIPGA